MDAGQVMLTAKDYQGSMDVLARSIRRGDVIGRWVSGGLACNRWAGVSGCPGKTKVGQLSVVASELDLLAPCFHDIPLHLKARSRPPLQCLSLIL